MRAHLTTLLIAALTALLAACAGLGGDEGGGDNLPNRGIVPYTPLSPDERFVLPASGAVRYRAPSAVVIGDAVHLYIEVDDPAEGGPSIGLTIDDGGDGDLTGVVEVFSDAAAPSVLRVPDLSGGADRWLLAYEDPVTAHIGLAEAPDGRAFVVLGASAVTPPQGGDIGAPSLVALPDGRFAIYHQLRVYGGGPWIIARSIAGPDLVFGPHEEVMLPGVDCTDAFGESESCWDADNVFAPEVRLATTSAGRHVYRMFYAAGQGSAIDIGFAASDDGQTFSRYANNPVVTASGAQSQPTNVRLGDRYLLYFDDIVAGLQGIALSVNEPDAPSESF